MGTGILLEAIKPMCGRGCVPLVSKVVANGSIGGEVLLSYKQVLTAAHCSNTGDIRHVRFGDYHLSNSSDDKAVQTGHVMHFVHQ